jgi:hypothetical protein
MKLLLVMLTVPIFSFFCQKNVYPDKYIIKNIKKIQRHYYESDYNKQKRTEALNAIIFRIELLKDNRISLTEYCKTINFIINKLEKNPRRNYHFELSKLRTEASNNFHQLNLQLFSEIANDSLLQMSSHWKNVQYLIAQNDVKNYRYKYYIKNSKGNWINPISYEKQYLEVVYSKILKYYFSKLKDSQNIQSQGEIVSECLNLFPNIEKNGSKEFNIINLILSGWDNNPSWTNGTVNLFSLNYLDNYLNSVNDDNFAIYLRGLLNNNRKENNYSISSVQQEILTFKNGRLIDTNFIFINEKHSLEIIFNKIDNLSRFYPLFNVQLQINYLENGKLCLSEFHEYKDLSTVLRLGFRYHFKDGKNLELEDLENKIIQTRALISEKKFDEALLVLDSAYNIFPKQYFSLGSPDLTNNQNIELAQLKTEVTQQYNHLLSVLKDKSEKINELIDKKEYSKALKVLQDARDNRLSNSNEYNILFEKEIEEVNFLIQDELEKLTLLENKINEGKILLKSKKYWEAKDFFEKTRKENQFSDTLKQNKELDLLIITATNHYNKDIELKIQKQKKEQEIKIKSAKNNAQVTTQSNKNETIQRYNNVPEREKCFRCDGTGNCRNCHKVFTTHYWAGKSKGWKNDNRTQLGYIMCSDCSGSGLIYGTFGINPDPSSKKCYVNGCINGWEYCSECNTNGKGKYLGKCWRCNGSGYKN